MSGQPDTSDDLIAELARLMATNAKPDPAPAPVARTASPPTPIRIPGSGSAPPRIPGGDPAVETRPPAPVVRIPGMDLPPPGSTAPGASPAPSVTAPVATAVPVRHDPPRSESTSTLAAAAPSPQPRVPGEHATPATPIHVVPAAPPVDDADPIAAIIAAELDSPAAAPLPGAAAVAAAQRFPAAPVPAKFSAQPRPASAPSSPSPRPLSIGGQAPRPAPAAPVNLRQAPPPRPLPVESDTFGVPPVLGIGRPSPRSAPDGDPMDEIESLIGEAVRVEMDRPAPVVTPVGGLAPRRTQPIEPKSEASAPRSADEAILAAAAATGADVDVIDSPEPAVRTPSGRVVLPPTERRPGSGMRQYIGMAVAGTLLLAAGFGLYWVLGLGRTDGTVPVLTADASPVKVAPDPVTTSATGTETRSPVLDELDGVTDSTAETLVSTDESAGADVAAIGADDVLESGLANRRVRTVTVRPDGTIVSGDDSVAGSEPMPAGRPNVPEVPGATASATDVLASAAEGVAIDPIAAVIANPDAAPETTDMALADPATTAPINLDPSIPIPLPPMLNRPTEPMVDDAAPLSAVNATTDNPLPSLSPSNGAQPLDLLAPLEVQPPTATAEAPPPRSSPGNPAPAYVQLSAQRDEATALADARRFTQRFASVIGETPLEVHIVDLGAKGTWYRVLLPASSSSAANNACTSIKSAGGDCLIR